MLDNTDNIQMIKKIRIIEKLTHFLFRSEFKIPNETFVQCISYNIITISIIIKHHCKIKSENFIVLVIIVLITVLQLEMKCSESNELQIICILLWTIFKS